VLLRRRTLATLEGISQRRAGFGARECGISTASTAPHQRDLL
jgi:hypothetical protein